MAPIKVAVINASVALADNDVQPVVNVLQQQVTNDFVPAWGIDAQLQFVKYGEPPPLDAWWLSIQDDSDRAGDLGYHDVSDADLPVGKVFVATAKGLGYDWTGTASHELLEMLVDPQIQMAVYAPQTYNTFFYAYEVCDPCEAEKFGYKIDGTLVSDFVFPAWFEPLRPTASTKFDYGGYIQAPFQTLLGSHVDVFDVCQGRWRTFWGEGRAQSTSEVGEAREELRKKPRRFWRKSEVIEVLRRHPERYREPSPRVEDVADTLEQLSTRLRELEERLTRFRR